MAITGIDLQPPYVNVIPVLTSALVENVSAVDVDASMRMIYWTDIKAGAIRRSHLNGSNIQTVVDSGKPMTIAFLNEDTHFVAFRSSKSIRLSGRLDIPEFVLHLVRIRQFGYAVNGENLG